MKLDDKYGRTAYLDEIFCKPGDITINLPQQEFDKIVYQLLLWLHTNSNMQKFIQEKSEQQFYGNPEQYVKALAFLLKKCAKDIHMFQIDMYEIEDPARVNFDVVSKAPEPQNMILNFNPDSLLGISHKNKTYLIDCKSFFAEKGKLRSLNSSEFHIVISGEMKIPHFTDSRKSGLFLEKYYNKEMLFVNPKINFDDFFIVRKEKSSRTAFFKGFQRIQLM